MLYLYDYTTTIHELTIQIFVNFLLKLMICLMANRFIDQMTKFEKFNWPDHNDILKILG